MSSPQCHPQVVRNYGVRPDGSFGVRGFRAYCPGCGTLGPFRENVLNAQGDKNRHTPGRFPTPRKVSA